MSRIFSTDHRTIGTQYFFLGLFSVLIGVALSLVMRYHVVHPTAVGGAIKPETYLALMTMHGTIMVFFVLTVVPQSAFGNYLLPLQIGAREMAFPILNMLSFWTTLLSLIVLLAAFFVEGGAPISGWTAYPPLSGVGRVAGPGEGLGQTLWIVSIGIFCIASVMGSLNFVATIADLRCKGMTLMRMPLTCWAWLITAILSLLAFSVLLSAAVLLLIDRTAGTSFFLPGGLYFNDAPIAGRQGGSPLLWQHLFWFFGHPEVYIAILPGMAITSHVISTFSRKPVFGYRSMVFAMLGIAFLGFVVWGHHMFMSGMSPYSAIAFSVLSLAIGVPSAIKTFNWIGTMWGGAIRLTTSMLFAIGFVSVFVTGGLSGIFLGQPALDLYFHDTFFVVAHFHMIMGVAAIFGIFAGTFFWFPKMFGRMLNERLGKLHFYLTFAGAYAVFLPMHFLGMAGNPRRYADYTSVDFLGALMPVHRFITHAAYVTAAAQLIFLVNFFWSLKKGPPASANPWEATTLEWSAAAGRPTVHHGPYEYSSPGAPADFTMQDESPNIRREA